MSSIISKQNISCLLSLLLFFLFFPLTTLSTSRLGSFLHPNLPHDGVAPSTSHPNSQHFSSPNSSPNPCGILKRHQVIMPSLAQTSTHIALESIRPPSIRNNVPLVMPRFVASSRKTTLGALVEKSALIKSSLAVSSRPNPRGSANTHSMERSTLIKSSLAVPIGSNIGDNTHTHPMEIGSIIKSSLVARSGPNPSGNSNAKSVEKSSLINSNLAASSKPNLVANADSNSMEIGALIKSSLAMSFGPNPRIGANTNSMKNNALVKSSLAVPSGPNPRGNAQMNSMEINALIKTSLVVSYKTNPRGIANTGEKCNRQVKLGSSFRTQPTGQF